MSRFSELKSGAFAWRVFGVVMIGLMFVFVAMINTRLTKDLTELEVAMQAQQSDARLEALRFDLMEQAEHLTRLTQNLLGLEEKVRSATAQSMREFSQAMEERISAVESRPPVLPPGWTTMSEQLDRLHKEVERLAQKTKQPPASAALAGPVSKPVTPPKPAEPPFYLNGIEMRGGEWLLSFTPKTARSRDSAHLMRTGESLNGWFLRSLDSGTVTFEHHGRVHTLAFPESAI